MTPSGQILMLPAVWWMDTAGGLGENGIAEELDFTICGWYTPGCGNMARISGKVSYISRAVGLDPGGDAWTRAVHPCTLSRVFLYKTHKHRLVLKNTSLSCSTFFVIHPFLFS
ncbi:MAG: hypothetical protein FRX48_01050 [Lasallia pustulata]|uniref:Uncharacterized protein n=1 Tax=Lasallia pustulata TaxID=136370 RepID=A0A5M8Q4I6_9LECA|nr:MAG: hypothetical protein FRX48_01050 [Lasallia pustulata]